MSEHIIAQFMHNSGHISATDIYGESIEECESKARLWADGMRSLEYGKKKEDQDGIARKASDWDSKIMESENCGKDTYTKITPYYEFVISTPDQLAEKLLKASCCYCVFGKGQGMDCGNKSGTDCKEGILAYLQGKTLD